MRSPQLEIACFHLESALIAAKFGADRIEFCADYKSGGVTPDLNEVKFARSKTNAFLSVMIRPRGGNFNYSENEFKEMKRSISDFKSLNVDGFVFGILDSENKIDSERNSELVKLAKPLRCTFHRAFDEVKDLNDAIENVIECGFDFLLTSGGKKKFDVSSVKKLIEKANGRIEIIIGGGIRSNNISDIIHQTGATIFHSSAIIDESEIADIDEIKLLKQKLKIESLFDAMK